MRLSGILLQPIPHRAHSLLNYFVVMPFVIPSLIVTRGFADCQYGLSPKNYTKKVPPALA